MEVSSAFTWTRGEKPVDIYIVPNCSWTRVRSGFYASENPEIQELCSRTLRSAASACCTIPLAYIVLAVLYGFLGLHYTTATVGFFCAAIAQRIILLTVVRAVQTRNAPYCKRCLGCQSCCGANRLGMLRCYCLGAASTYLTLGLVTMAIALAESALMMFVFLLACRLLHLVAAFSRRLQRLLPKADVFSGGAVILEDLPTTRTTDSRYEDGVKLELTEQHPSLQKNSAG